MPPEFPLSGLIHSVGSEADIAGDINNLADKYLLIVGVFFNRPIEFRWTFCIMSLSHRTRGDFPGTACLIEFVDNSRATVRKAGT
jgi:hypothetical protein